MANGRHKSGEILLYNNSADCAFVSVIFKDENFWLTQKAKKDSVAEKFSATAGDDKNAMPQDSVSAFDRETAKYLKGGEPD